MIGLTLATASTVYPLAVSQVKLHLAIDTDDADEYLKELIQDATDWLEDHYLVACCEQTWDEILDGFPPAGIPIELYRWPIQSVSSITYLDGSGGELTLSTSDWSTNLASIPPRIAPAGMNTWPANWANLGSVRIRFVAGAADPKDVPHRFRRERADAQHHVQQQECSGSERPNQ